MTTTDDTLSPLVRYNRALPYRASHALHHDHRTIAAVTTLAERGDDMAALAQRHAHGLHRRPGSEINRILRYRLLRDAGLLDDDQEADN